MMTVDQCMAKARAKINEKLEQQLIADEDVMRSDGSTAEDIAINREWKTQEVERQLKEMHAWLLRGCEPLQ